MNNTVEQAIRISHCSNTGKEHACVGVCTISKKGVELNCTLCGSDTEKMYNPNEWLEDRIIVIFKAAGIAFENLAEEVKVRVLREYGKDFCPNCKRLMFHTQSFNSHYSCKCGWNWSNYRGWNAPANGTATIAPDHAGGQSSGDLPTDTGTVSGGHQ